MRTKHIGCIGEGCPICPKLELPGYAMVRAHLTGEPLGANVSKRFSLPCVHRGVELRQEPCVDCVKARVKVFACAIHGECTIGKLARGADGRYLQNCSGCQDRQEPQEQKREKVLLKFMHGLGDAVQLTVILQHLQKYRPHWDLHLLARKGRQSIGVGYCTKMWHDEEPAPPLSEFDEFISMAWEENVNRYGDHPSTKATRFLRQVLKIEPEPALLRYKIHVSRLAKDAAANYLRSIGCTERDGRFNAVVVHYEGTSLPAQKNLPHEVVGAACETMRGRGFVPVILDFGKHSPIPDGATVFRPEQDAEFWGESGLNDAEKITALISRAAYCVGIDSGPGHCAGATDTPTIIVWTKHLPAQYYDLCPNVTHLIPENWRHVSPGDSEKVAEAMVRLYKLHTYSDLAGELCNLLRARLPLPPKNPGPEWQAPESHPGTIFPDTISTVAAQVRGLMPTVTYDHRPALHPCDHDIAWKLTEEFRKGYAAIKWAVAKVIQPRSIIEIGVGGGLAALAFLDACPAATYLGFDNGQHEKETGVPLIAHIESIFAERGYSAAIQRADSLRLTSLPYADLIHVDGNHEYKYAEHDVAMAIASGAPWILIDDARDNQVCAAAFTALLKGRPGATEWAMFEDTWTGSILVYTGEGAR